MTIEQIMGKIKAIDDKIIILRKKIKRYDKRNLDNLPSFKKDLVMETGNQIIKLLSIKNTLEKEKADLERGFKL